MQIIAASPFSSGSLRWQPRPGAWALTVICKATFHLIPGEMSVAAAADPLNDADDYWNDDPRRSLHAASDLVPFKRRADVVLVGHAYAPPGQAVSSLVARLVVAGVDKALEAHADRVWTPEGQLLEGARFTKMPLRWERAAGGPDTINPVGVHVNARPDAYGRVPLPNLQPLGIFVGWRDDVIAPVGFGPIAAFWPMRRGLLHRHAATWDPVSWAEHPLPPDIDAAFFNVAPPDQQVDELHADERMALEGLHPEHARLVTRLPGLLPRATVEREGVAGAQPIRMRCDTLSVDTDRGVCHLVWRGQVALTRPDERGRVMITAELPSPEEIGETIAPGLVGPALPFGASERSFDPSDTAKTLPPGGGDASETLFLSPAVGSANPLPFQEGRSPWTEVGRTFAEVTPAHTEGEDTGTLFGVASIGGDTLPFAPSASPEPPLAKLVPIAAAPPMVAPPMAAMPPPVQPMPPQATAPPFVSPGAHDAAPPSEASPPSQEPDTERPMGLFSPAAGPPSPPVVGLPPPVVGPPPPPAPMVGPPPPPPPMLAPLGLGTAKKDAPAQAVAAPAAELVAAARVEPEPDPEPIPLERVAAVAAEIAEEKAPRAAVLAKHDLTERAFVASERRWAEAIADEAGQGSSKLRTAYDQAYVGAVEKLRGPITLAEYSRIVVGLERGRANQVMDDLRIQRPALMRIVRIWTKKVASDAKLGEEAARLLMKLRVS